MEGINKITEEMTALRGEDSDRTDRFKGFQKLQF